MKNFKKAASSGIGATRRKIVSKRLEDLVTIEPLFADRNYPTLIRPNVDGLLLAEWGSECRELVERLLWEKRSLLFRGFELGGVEGFESFVLGTSDGKPLPYRDRTTPRETYGDNIYCTTVFPPAERMAQHNEGSYWVTWSLKAFFACITAPATGGETPIADTHAIHNRIDPAIREQFARKNWAFVRNFNQGLGLPWQEVFQTEDRTEVEEFCSENRIECAWMGAEGLRTRQVRKAIHLHPKSHEPLWFNHIAFYHISSRPQQIRDVLLDSLGEESLPFNTTYGDGTRIEPEIIEEINAAYDAEELRFTWQEGDMHLIDNMRLTHGRQPYTGDRLILVALTEAYSGAAV